MVMEIKSPLNQVPNPSHIYQIILVTKARLTVPSTASSRQPIINTFSMGLIVGMQSQMMIRVHIVLHMGIIPSLNKDPMLNKSQPR